MGGLVIELQREALDSSMPVSKLLRKALVVSRKLRIKEFQAWIELELNGYAENSEIPPYRKVNGELKAWNPYRGWTPIMFDDGKFAKKLSSRELASAASVIEELLSNDKGGGSYQIPFNKEEEVQIMEMLKYPLRPTFFIDKSSLYCIVNAVKNIILDWSLKLEESGIMGEGMTFSEKEKEVASGVIYNITGDYIASVEGDLMNRPVNSQIQNRTSHSKQSLSNQTLDIKAVAEFIKDLKSSINELEISPENKSELDADITSIEAQIISPMPKIGIIKECFHTIRNILEGIAGSLIATSLQSQLLQLTANLPHS